MLARKHKHKSSPVKPWYTWPWPWNVWIEHHPPPSARWCLSQDLRKDPTSSFLLLSPRPGARQGLLLSFSPHGGGGGAAREGSDGGWREGSGGLEALSPPAAHDIKIGRRFTGSGGGRRFGFYEGRFRPLFSSRSRARLSSTRITTTVRAVRCGAVRRFLLWLPPFLLPYPPPCQKQKIKNSPYTVRESFF